MTESSEAQTAQQSSQTSLADLPAEVLANVFNKLDIGDLTRCYRLCKSINQLLTETPSLILHHTLQSSHLILHPKALQANPHIPAHIPPTSSELLATLRERITRFRNLSPSSTRVAELKEPDGNLYEFLEGVLLRSIGSSRSATVEGLAVYDMRQGAGWEDVTEGAEAGDGESDGAGGEGDEEVIDGREGVDDDQSERREYRPDFPVKECAVDPGQDLLIVTEVEALQPGQGYCMKFHMLSLTTFERHPRASRQVIQWPVPMARKSIQLEFQICDDGFYVLKKGGHQDDSEQICGWQWTSGRLAVVAKPPHSSSFEALILLTPSSFIVPTVVTHINGDIESLEGEIDVDSVLSWTHHLRVYAFPPLANHTPDPDSPEPHAPSHTAVHVATVDLPKFFTALNQNMPPPRLTLRCDPPPRNTFPTHPSSASYGPPPFVPDPKTGIFVVEFYCQHPDPEVEDPHYTMIFLKETLLRLLPPPDSPLLSMAFTRPAPIVAWETIAPEVRLFDDLHPQTWVCYVYHHRFVTLLPDPEFIAHPHLPIGLQRTQSRIAIYDFDPLLVKAEKNRRKLELEADGIDPETQSLGGYDEDDVELVLDETVVEKSLPLLEEVRTGSKLGYVKTEQSELAYHSALLIDQERIISVSERASIGRRGRMSEMTIMEF